MGRMAASQYLIALLIILAVVTGASGCSRLDEDQANQANVTVPAAYKKLYENLKSDLDSYDAYLDGFGSRYGPPIFGAELLPANCNRGEELLKPKALEGTVLYMDRLREMGVEGVTIALNYPLYQPGYPRHQEYVDYYKQVVQGARKRGMKVEVESGVIFSGTAFSTVDVDYENLTFDRYLAEKKQMIAAIISDLRPDYMDIGAEPDTEYGLTGMEELNSPEKYTEYVNYVLDGLDRGSTKVGAGIGSWGNTAYVESFAANTSLDFIAVHVYPVDQRSLRNLHTIASIARGHNKSIVMDEAWLYKTERAALSVAANDEIFRRDAYSFWAPLDQQFLSLMVRTSEIYGIEYISPFWANYFFSYVDYGLATAWLPYEELVTVANREAAKDIAAGKRSPTGEHYRQLIARSK